ncbi:GNAT family N-acetyltransferase [Halobacillus massiliensis]|uniref:GNAT family N-acetyltransferase n=1 Tax=Halobacillus massiliensis TaxID=1926286 RepID=UPI0009E27576|nr:GNAT family protein [Halobacillus massiliensis]
MNAILHRQRLSLGTVTDEHLLEIEKWFLNSQFMRNLDAEPARPKNLDSLKKWREEALNSDKHFLFSISESDNFIGYVELSGILWNQRNGWVAIAIGNPDNQAKGHGSEAMELLINYAFHELNLHRLQLTVFEYNQHAISLYKKLGFTYEGAQREFVIRDGEAYDMLMYGLLQREWSERKAAEKLEE